MLCVLQNDVQIQTHVEFVSDPREVQPSRIKSLFFMGVGHGANVKFYNIMYSLMSVLYTLH